MRNTFSTLPGYQGLTVVQKKRLHELTLLYAFRCIKYGEYIGFLKECTHEFMAVSQLQEWIRVHVLENAYLMHNIKHWVYNTICMHTDAAVMARRCNIHAADYRMHVLFMPGTELHAHISKLGTKPRPPKRTRLIIDEIVQNNMDYLAKFVYRKLRFISMYWAVDPQELIHDIMCRGIRALRHEWPNYPSRAYMENLYRRSAQNEGKNIIDRATSQKNARLVGVNGGFQTVTVSWDQMLEQGVVIPDPVDWQKHIDLTIDINQITDGQVWRKRTIGALSGYEAEFSAWLQNRDIHTDNEAYLEDVGIDECSINIARWLNIPTPMMRKFIQELQSSLRVWAPETVS